MDKEAFRKGIDAATQALNDAGLIEAQWALQGFADTLIDESDVHDAGDVTYGRCYRAGVEAARNLP